MLIIIYSIQYLLIMYICEEGTVRTLYAFCIPKQYVEIKEIVYNILSSDLNQRFFR